MSGWIGVDLDGTLAFYESGHGIDSIGEPIAPMVARVNAWLEQGIRVKLVTARANPNGTNPKQMERFMRQWRDWSTEQFGQVLEVTYSKDFEMVELWDDRAVTVDKNTGEVLTRGREDE